ncbi:hypothetical protein VNO80_03245 [Phaseolus coccineus]|uniref:Uncharacterized protein n=1 Tax=Phaseolus coccineus TaxID=3886 RepID=A0AAN9NYB7_PHACN
MTKLCLKESVALARVSSLRLPLGLDLLPPELSLLPLWTSQPEVVQLLGVGLVNVGALIGGVLSCCRAPNSLRLVDFSLTFELLFSKWPSIPWQKPALFTSWRRDKVGLHHGP